MKLSYLGGVSSYHYQLSARKSAILTLNLATSQEFPLNVELLKITLVDAGNFMNLLSGSIEI